MRLAECLQAHEICQMTCPTEAFLSSSVNIDIAPRSTSTCNAGGGTAQVTYIKRHDGSLEVTVVLIFPDIPVYCIVRWYKHSHTRIELAIFTA